MTLSLSSSQSAAVVASTPICDSTAAAPTTLCYPQLERVRATSHALCVGNCGWRG